MTTIRNSSLLQCLRGATSTEYLTTVGAALVIGYGVHHLAIHAKDKFRAQGDALAGIEDMLPVTAAKQATPGTSTIAQAVPQGPTTNTNAAQLAQLVFRGYNSKNKVPGAGPITVTPAQVTENGRTRQVYVVTVSGTEEAAGQATFIRTDLASGVGGDNRLLQAVRGSLQEAVPEGSEVILAGHSLGGMVAQQAAGDGWIKDNYQVSNTVTFGSPLITPPGGREGRVTRLSDSSDPIPVLSADTVMNPVQGILGPHYETSRYNNIDAHTHSYVDPAVWGNYDALGQKNGSATITTDSSQSRFFQAPTGDATH